MNTSSRASAQTHLVGTPQETATVVQGGTQRSQDVREIQTFYEENVAIIYRYIYSKVGNREEAEDLTSQTFMKVVRSVDQARGEHSMQKWLFQVAKTTVADYWRGYYRAATSSLDALLDAGWEVSTEEDVPSMSTAPTERVQRILEALPERYREVLTCRFLLNLSIKETAMKMGLTEANVKVLQFRALRHAADIDQVLVERV